jgi:perosamine synthetase
MKKEDLAIFGGPKAIDRPHPHWQWPPPSQARIDAVARYMENPVDNAKGYPVVVEAFERRFAEYQGSKYVIGMNACTSALFAAFFAVGLGEGDEIIAPTMTFIATATPVVRLNATAVFCDCEPDTGNIDPDDIRKRITKKTKAIVITHLCGHPCEMDPIVKIARENDLYLIEDCAHAHGSTYRGRKVGTFGDIACFSMGRKILTGGEAGILLTDDQRLFERALMVSDFGPRLEHDLVLPETRRYVETGHGMKSRMNPLSAAILSHELDMLDTYIQQRREKLDYLSKGIEGLPGLAPPVTRPYATRGGYYSYRPFYKADELKGLDMDTFMRILHAEGMEVRRSNNPPLHRLPLFMDLSEKTRDTRLPASEAFYDKTLSMPTFTLEPLDILDEYIAAFGKVCEYFAFSNQDLKELADAPGLKEAGE